MSPLTNLLRHSQSSKILNNHEFCIFLKQIEWIYPKNIEFKYIIYDKHNIDNL